MKRSELIETLSEKHTDSFTDFDWKLVEEQDKNPLNDYLEYLATFSDEQLLKML